MPPTFTNTRLLVGAGLALLACLAWFRSGGVDAPAPVPATATANTIAAPSPSPTESAPLLPVVDAAVPQRVAADEPGEGTEVRITCVWEDGAPAVGMPVYAWQLAAGRMIRPEDTIASDRSGHVTFLGLPPEEHEFGTSRVTTKAVPAPGRRIEATLRLPQVAQASGIVVDADGRPAAGATICREASHPGQPIATADARGRFLVRLASAGGIWASKEGHAPSRVHQVDADVVHLELRLAPAGASLAGSVLDPDGRAVPHAAISIATDLEVGHGHPTTPPVMLVADAHGAFATTQVPRQPLLVYATARGFAYGQQAVDTTDRDHANVVVRVRRAATIHGILLTGEARNTPLVGARIHASRGRLLTGLLAGSSGRLTRMFALSDATGRYRLTGIAPGRVLVGLTIGNGESKNHSVLLQEGQEYEWSPDLSQPSAVIRGTLLGPEGEALADMLVQAARFDPVEMLQQTSQAITDAQGNFELQALRPFPHTLSVRAAAPEPFAQRADVRPDGPPLVWQLSGLPSQSGTISGRLLDPAGRAVVSAKFRAICDGITRAGTTTKDPAGGFRIEDLVPGSWRVLGEASEYGAFDLGQHVIQARAQVELGTITLPRLGRVIARVKGRGFEATGIALTLEETAGGRNRTDEFSADIGALRSPPLPPGRYHLLARGDNFAAVRREVEIPAGADVAVDLDVEAGTNVTIEFVPEGHDEQEWRDCVIFSLRDARGDVVVSKNLATRTTPATYQIALAPGSYTIESMARLTASREGKAAFVVPTTPTQPFVVRVDLEVLQD